MAISVIKLRRGTATSWTTANPVLADGEPGYDETNSQIRVGDGTTAWSGLTAIGGGGGGGGLTDGSVTPVKFAGSAIDPSAGTAGARTLGTGSQQAAPGTTLASAQTYADTYKDRKIHGRKYSSLLRNYEVGKVLAKTKAGQLRTLCAYDSIGYLGSMDEFHTNIKTRYGGLPSGSSYPLGWQPFGGSFGWSQSANRVTVADAVTINTSTTVTSATAAFVSTDTNRTVTGTGIPAGATIVTVNSATNITISIAATSGGSGRSLTVGPSALAGGVDGYMVQLLNAEYITRPAIIQATGTVIRIFFDPSSTGTFQASMGGTDFGAAIDTSSGTYTHGTVKYVDLTSPGSFFGDFKIRSTSGTCLIWGVYMFTDVDSTHGNMHIQFNHPGMGIYDYNRFPRFQAFLQWFAPHALFTNMFINDDGRGATTYGTEITTFVNACRTSSPNTDIIWNSQHGTLSHPNASALHDKLIDRANALNFFLIDHYEVQGDYSTANANGLISGDGVHYSTLGKDIMSDTMTSVLEGMESVKGDYVKQDGTSVASFLTVGTYGITATQGRMELRTFGGQTFMLSADGTGSTAWPWYLGDPTIVNSGGTLTLQFGARIAEVYNNRISRVRTITTANDTLSGLAARNGYTPVSGDLILVNAQTTGANNGIYIAASGAWSRSLDMFNTALWTTTDNRDKPVYVQSGNAAGTLWFLTNTGPVTIGTTTPLWAQFIPTNVPFANVLAPAGSFSMNSQKITSLLDGTAATDSGTVKQDQGQMWKSGYYTSPKFVTQSTTAFTLGNLLVVPFFLATRQSVAAIGVDVTVLASAGGKLRFQAYADAGLGGLPGVNLWNGAQIACDTTLGWTEDTAVSGTFVGPGWVFFGCVSQTAAPTIRSITQLVESLPATAPTGGTTPTGWLTTGVTSAAGPAPWTTTTQGATSPLIKVKLT